MSEKPFINEDGSCSYTWVDFYKASGKWYNGGVVFMGNVKPWDVNEDVIEAIWKYQKILNSGTDRKQWTIVVDDLGDLHRKPEYKYLWKRVLQVGKK